RPGAEPRHNPLRSISRWPRSGFRRAIQDRILDGAAAKVWEMRQRSLFHLEGCGAAFDFKSSCCFCDNMIMESSGTVWVVLKRDPLFGELITYAVGLRPVLCCTGCFASLNHSLNLVASQTLAHILKPVRIQHPQFILLEPRLFFLDFFGITVGRKNSKIPEMSKCFLKQIL